jgi:hypothetical protein
METLSIMLEIGTDNSELARYKSGDANSGKGRRSGVL